MASQKNPSETAPAIDDRRTSGATTAQMQKFIFNLSHGM